MKVDPERYLEHLRVAHNEPALTYEGVYSVNVALLDQIAEETIRGSMRIDAAEGAAAWEACSPSSLTSASSPPLPFR